MHKNNHTCCDATGVKEYLQLLSDIYTAIEPEMGIFVPKPRRRTRSDQDRLFETLGIKDPDSAWNPLLEIPKTLWPFPWQPGLPEIPRTVISKIPAGHIEGMRKYGKSRDATINDLLLTSYYRVMFELSQPPYDTPMDIGSTVDLRRYLPDHKTEAIRCFSGGIYTKLSRKAQEPFDSTLARVVSMMKEIKRNTPGLQSAVGLERIEKANFHETIAFYRTAGQNYRYTDMCAPALSNLGYLSKTPFKFGDATVTDAHIVPPSVCAPGLLICIGSYNDIMTMAISYYDPQVPREFVENILLLIKSELIHHVC